MLVAAHPHTGCLAGSENDHHAHHSSSGFPVMAFRAESSRSSIMLFRISARLQMKLIARGHLLGQDQGQPAGSPCQGATCTSHCSQWSWRKNRCRAAWLWAEHNRLVDGYAMACCSAALSMPNHPCSV